MTKPRRSIVSLGNTPYYHCISRCVRRAFLCGIDAHSGRSFEHRRHWIESRLKTLSSLFAIDLCAYAIMSNHYHVVLRVDQKEALEWSQNEVIRRWLNMFRGPELVHRYLSGKYLDTAGMAGVDDLANLWRDRLMDISWFMRCINEPIAREANKEDDCTGRFWEGRFKSQALLDYPALLSCMAYVDLNPIRAGLAESPERSDFTSVQARIEAFRSSSGPKSYRGLRPFSGCDDDRDGIPYKISDYLQLVDWAGRAIVHGKKGSIPQDFPPILDRLQLQPKKLITYLGKEQSLFCRAIGHANKMQQLARKLGLKFLKGTKAAKQLIKSEV